MAAPLTGAAKDAAEDYVEIKRRLKGPRDNDPQGERDKLTWVFPAPS